MTVWLLVVTLLNGRTVAAPFETEKECKQALKDVKKEMKDLKIIKTLECSQGELSQDKEPDSKPEDITI